METLVCLTTSLILAVPVISSIGECCGITSQEVEAWNKHLLQSRQWLLNLGSLVTGKHFDAVVVGRSCYGVSFDASGSYTVSLWVL